MAATGTIVAALVGCGCWALSRCAPLFQVVSHCVCFCAWQECMDPHRHLQPPYCTCTSRCAFWHHVVLPGSAWCCKCWQPGGSCCILCTYHWCDSVIFVFPLASGTAPLGCADAELRLICHTVAEALHDLRRNWTAALPSVAVVFLVHYGVLPEHAWFCLYVEAEDVIRLTLDPIKTRFNRGRRALVFPAA